MKRVAVDLGSELAECRVATEGARVMADVLVCDAATDDETREQMPRRISAALTLIVERLRQVERAVNSALNPKALRTYHNASLAPDGLHLREWDAKRLLQELERERRRLDHEGQRAQRRRRA